MIFSFNSSGSLNTYIYLFIYFFLFYLEQTHPTIVATRLGRGQENENGPLSQSGVNIGKESSFFPSLLTLPWCRRRKWSFNNGAERGSLSGTPQYLSVSLT